MQIVTGWLDYTDKNILFKQRIEYSHQQSSNQIDGLELQRNEQEDCIPWEKPKPMMNKETKFQFLHSFLLLLWTITQHRTITQHNDENNIVIAI